MALKPKRPCFVPTCPYLQPCPDHSKHYDRRRPSAARRGYGSRWQAYSKAYLEEHPFCVQCGQPSCQTDHKIPVSGPDDPLFWDPENHQALCRTCHSSKTARQSSGWGR